MVYKKAWAILDDHSLEAAKARFNKHWCDNLNIKFKEVEVLRKASKNMVGQYKFHYYEWLQKFPSPEGPRYFQTSIEKPKKVEYPFTTEELRMARDIDGKFIMSQKACDRESTPGICPVLAIETFKKLGYRGQLICGSIGRPPNYIHNNWIQHCWVEYDGKVYDFNNLEWVWSYRISKIDRRIYRPIIKADSIEEFYRKIKRTDLLSPRRTKLMVNRLEKQFARGNSDEVIQ